jgi:hypothetical protein
MNLVKEIENKEYVIDGDDNVDEAEESEDSDM